MKLQYIHVYWKEEQFGLPQDGGCRRRALTHDARDVTRVDVRLAGELHGGCVDVSAPRELLAPSEETGERRTLLRDKKQKKNYIKHTQNMRQHAKPATASSELQCAQASTTTSHSNEL